VPKTPRRLPIAVIGAGKVGTTIAVLLHRAHCPIVSVVSKNERSARRLARLVGCRHASNAPSAIPAETRLVVIAAPEDAFDGIVRSLCSLPERTLRGLFCVHLSGAVSSSVLQPLRKRGTTTFSLHPIQTFPSRLPVARQIERMHGVPYAFEGPRDAVRCARRIVRNLGGKMIVIPKEGKILYHSACVFASNYPLIMLGAAERILAGLGSDIRIDHLRRLVEASIENALTIGSIEALTGPVARGSRSTIEAHLWALRRFDPSIAELYRQCGISAAGMARAHKRLTARQSTGILKTLKHPTSKARKH